MTQDTEPTLTERWECPPECPYQTSMLRDLPEEPEPVKRLTRDILEGLRSLSPGEARFLVDSYYELQDYRIQANNQIRALGDAAEPNSVLWWLASQMTTLEKEVARGLAAYSGSQDVGRWAESIVGIGPVISAGLLAHIDIEAATTVGKVWRFAGLDPTSQWLPGTRRPWNGDLKVLCWKLGESFVKVSNNKNDIYGKVWRERKEYEQARNDRGELAEQAEAILARKKIRKETEAYKHYSVGKLPPAHIHARAKRYAVKLFLAHWHEVAWFDRYGVLPELPYILSQPRHTHWMQAPNPHLIDGLPEAQAVALNEFRKGL